MIGAWEFQNEESVTSLERSFKEQLYKLFIDQSRSFKEETEDYLKYDDIIPEFFISKDLHVKNKIRKINFKRQLTINQYENIAAKFLQPKSDLNIYRPIQEAMLVARNIDSSFSKKRINLVLFTGGTSTMQSVQRALKAYFAGKPCFSIDEEEACSTVAMGAAACRFDELYGGTKVEMRNRLLECIFTRFQNDKSYTKLVPLECEPTKNFNKISGIFQLNRPTIRFRLPLFRGVDANDHQLSPIRDLEIPLDAVIDSNTPYELHYRMTENKTIALKVTFKGTNGPIEKVADFAIFDDKVELRKNVELCRINTI